MFVVITYHVVMVMVYVTSISNLSESFLVKASVFAFGIIMVKPVINYVQIKIIVTIMVLVWLEVRSDQMSPEP